jgi:hypothetical protein
LAGIAAVAWLVVAAGTDRVEAVGEQATWILSTVGDLKSKPPPVGEAATAELAAFKTMIANRNASDIAQARWWDVGGPAYRWNEIAVNEMLAHFVTVPQQDGTAVPGSDDATCSNWTSITGRPPGSAGEAA